MHDILHPRKSVMATSTGPARREDPETEVVFADERARVAWEIGRALEPIIATIPPESQTLEAKTIRFDPPDLSKGTYAIFLSGTVIGTDREGVFLVPQRSLRILDRLGIPYRAA